MTAAHRVGGHGTTATAVGRRIANRKLLAAYHDHGDQAARAQLIEANMPLVRTLARHFARSGEPLDELVQVGAIGLIKAVDGFRLERGSDFGAYAVPTILGELRRHARRTLRAGADGEPIPSLEDLPAEATAGLVDLERSEQRVLLRGGFRRLSGRERRVVALRFYGDLSQRRIGDEIGLSQVQVSRVLQTSLAKLRTALER